MSAADGTVRAERRPGAAARAGAGAVGGVVAGLVMAMVALCHTSFLGLGFWLPMKLVAGVFWGVRVIIGGVWITLAGIAIHLAVSAVAGALFGVLFGHRINAIVGVALGIAFGGVVWAVNTYLVLPWADPVMLQREMVAPVWWFVYHLVFGAVLVLVPVFTRLQADSRPLFD